MDRHAMAAAIARQDLHQLARLEFGPDIPGGAQCDTEAGQHRLADHFGGVRHHNRRHWHGHRSLRAFQPPMVGIVHKQFVAREVREDQRRAVAGEIGRRGTEQAMVRRELAGNKARIAEIGDAQSHIEAVTHDIDEGIRQREINGDLRVFLEKAHEMRCDMQAPERGRRGDAQGPARHMGALGNPGLRLVHRAENRDNPLLEATPRIGQHDLPRGALEQTRAEPLFQALDALGNDRRGQTQFARRLRHRARGGDAREDFEIAQPVHVAPPIRRSAGCRLLSMATI